MERSLLRWVLIGVGIFLVIQWLDPFGSKTSERQPLTTESFVAPGQRQPEQLCDIWTKTFRAQLTTRGASLKHFQLLTSKYRRDGKPFELSTTPDLEQNRQLRVGLRNGDPKASNWQIDFDSVDWQLLRSDGSTCEFTYTDDKVELRKFVRATGRPYELAVEQTVTNRAATALKHAAVVETHEWRRSSEVKGSIFAVSPFVTHVECVFEDSSAVRLQPTDFEPSDFTAAEFGKNPLNAGDWYQAKLQPDVAAISNAYFTHSLAPLEAQGASPSCQLLIEERWDAARHKKVSDDPNGGWMYRARLAYPAVELATGQSRTYKVLSYVGPKEREVLAAAAGGKQNLDELIDLGFFSEIAKVLVAFLLKVHSVVPNWGLAIVILTITARLLLFPLSLPSIRNMIKMRELKPELDALNEKYKADPQGKGLAQMEIWRKHKVNPFKGCLPQLASMPVWFALYTTLQTAVELYNIPFLWFPDLSRPDPYFVLPLIIGATYFVQQKILPMQGGDPMQQKMMLYMMPAMFTVMMLFLPAGLGVYMFTNSVLGILQQQAVEWHARRATPGGGGRGQIKVKFEDRPSKNSGKSGAGARKKGEAKLADGSAVLGKGKA
jgi:YidC/Oxa1 family membrane protein insertase